MVRLGSSLCMAALFASLLLVQQGYSQDTKAGDKAAWSARIAQGKPTLYTHAVAGFQGKAGVMPAKGGNAMLADADVKSAVDYMVSLVE